MKATNWNKATPTSTMFWNQNIRQFWIDEEIPLSDDKLTWEIMSPVEQEVYKKVTAVLTRLDSAQASIGMPEIGLKIEDPITKAIFSFMAMMEHMHAKSYSSIYSTLCKSSEIDELFDWVDNDLVTTEKLTKIQNLYQSINLDNGKQDLYMALTASVFLESFLFYSGFFYPLYMAGQGKLVASGEIINLIIRDESIHGVYVGMVAQELFNEFSPEEQEQLKRKTNELLQDLVEIEDRYTEQVYSQVGLSEEVKTFVRYNADKAMMNLNMEPVFNVDESQVNGQVIAGLDTKTKNHDFFSTKGNGYIKPTNISTLEDADFDF